MACTHKTRTLSLSLCLSLFHAENWGHGLVKVASGMLCLFAGMANHDSNAALWTYGVTEGTWLQRKYSVVDVGTCIYIYVYAYIYICVCVCVCVCGVSVHKIYTYMYRLVCVCVCVRVCACVCVCTNIYA